jgi:hypothetical protein
MRFARVRPCFRASRSVGQAFPPVARIFDPPGRVFIRKDRGHECPLYKQEEALPSSSRRGQQRRLCRSGEGCPCHPGARDRGEGDTIPLLLREVASLRSTSRVPL